MGRSQARPVALIHLHLHHLERSHGEVLTAPLVSQVGSVIHLVAQASMAVVDVEDVTADVRILTRGPDLALHRPVASTRKVRVQRGHQEGIEDQGATADMEDTSMQKVRLEKDTGVLEDLADVDEEDTEEDGDTMGVGDLLLSVAQEEWVGST